MNIGSSIYKVLTEDAAASGYLGDRVLPLRAGLEIDSVPFLVYRVDDAPPVASLLGNQDAYRFGITLSVVGDDYSELSEICSAVKDALESACGKYGSMLIRSARFQGYRDEFDNQGELFSKVMDFEIHAAVDPQILRMVWNAVQGSTGSAAGTVAGSVILDWDAVQISSGSGSGFSVSELLWAVVQTSIGSAIGNGISSFGWNAVQGSTGSAVGQSSSVIFLQWNATQSSTGSSTGNAVASLQWNASQGSTGSGVARAVAFLQWVAAQSSTGSGSAYAVAFEEWAALQTSTGSASGQVPGGYDPLISSLISYADGVPITKAATAYIDALDVFVKAALRNNNSGEPITKGGYFRVYASSGPGVEDWACVNILNPGTFNAGRVNSPLLVAKKGFKGGTNEYLDTGFNPVVETSFWGQDDSTVVVGLVDLVEGASNCIWGSSSGFSSNNNALAPFHSLSGSQVRCGLNGGWNGVTISAVADDKVLALRRVISSQFEVYDSTSWISSGATSVAPLNDDFYELARNENGTAQRNSASTLGFIWVGKALSQSTVENMKAAWVSYRATINAL